VDVRTLPFVRFEDNESHCQRRHAFNLGGGVHFGKPNVDGVGPDARHPFLVRNMRIWNVRWAIHPVSPSLLLDGVDMHLCVLGAAPFVTELAGVDPGLLRPSNGRQPLLHLSLPGLLGQVSIREHHLPLKQVEVREGA
jgi:hypothetical protein